MILPRSADKKSLLILAVLAGTGLLALTNELPKVAERVDPFPIPKADEVTPNPPCLTPSRSNYPQGSEGDALYAKDYSQYLIEQYGVDPRIANKIFQALKSGDNSNWTRRAPGCERDGDAFSPPQELVDRYVRQFTNQQLTPSPIPTQGQIFRHNRIEQSAFARNSARNGFSPKGYRGF